MNDATTNPTFNLAKLIEDAKSVVTDPVGFYRHMPKSGGYAEPAIFVVVIAAVIGLFFTLFSMLGLGKLIGMSAGMAGGVVAGVASIIFMPVMALIWSFIAALVMFVIWKLMGSPYGFETAYRSVAYSAAILPLLVVLNFVPYIGSIIGVCWGMYLLFIASQEVHGVARQTAAVVFGVLALLAIFFQISAEIATRKMSAKVEEFGGSMEELGESLEKMGEALEKSESAKAMEQMGDSLEQTDNAAELEQLGRELEEMTPEEAGRKLGEFFKGMEKALQEQQDNSAEKAE